MCFCALWRIYRLVSPLMSLTVILSVKVKGWPASHHFCLQNYKENLTLASFLSTKFVE